MFDSLWNFQYVFDKGPPYKIRIRWILITVENNPFHLYFVV